MKVTVVGPGVARTSVALLASVAFAAPTAAQQADVATAGLRHGMPVPAAYHRAIAEDPRAFTLPSGLFRTDAAGNPVAAAGIEGTRRVAVVPMLFADSPEPHVSRQTIQERIFDGPAPRATLTEAYREMSGGRLTVTGQVTPWTRTSLTLAEVVGESSGLDRNAGLGAAMLEALAGVDPTFDFGLYDNDGPDGLPNSGDDNGIVDIVAFEFIEVAASCGGPGVWPHLYGIAPRNDGQPYRTDDVRPDGTFVTVDPYIIQSAVDCAGTEPQDAAVIAHEFGHVLGLPDYYDPVDPANGSFGRRWILGCWDLMAAGAWGCGEHVLTDEPFGPTHMSARSKNRLDWVRYRDVGEVRNETLVLDPIQASEEALRIPVRIGEGREFLIVEYRTRTGQDEALPREGVLVYRMDIEGSLRPQPGAPYFLTVVERDDDGGLVRTAVEDGDRGTAGDVWGWDDGRLNVETRPDVMRLAGGDPGTTAIHEIRIEGGRAHVRLSTAANPAVAVPDDPVVVAPLEPFEVRVLVTGGAMPFQVIPTLPPGTSVAVRGDQLVVSGTLAPGLHGLELMVRDALGGQSPAVIVPVLAGEWVVTEERLSAALLGGAALSAVEAAYLDQVGNGNGRFDVGDLRAWLRRAR